MCTREHGYEEGLGTVPFDRGGHGQRKCAGCAYEAGFAAGLKREQVGIDLGALPLAKPGERHRSPHAAWALGYLRGVTRSYLVGRSGALLPDAEP